MKKLTPVVAVTAAALTLAAAPAHAVTGDFSQAGLETATAALTENNPAGLISPDRAIVATALAPASFRVELPGYGVVTAADAQCVPSPTHGC